MTEKLFQWSQKQKRRVNVSVILEELLVVQGAKRIMNMNSNVNTVKISYFVVQASLGCKFQHELIQSQL